MDSCNFGQHRNLKNLDKQSEEFPTKLGIHVIIHFLPKLIVTYGTLRQDPIVKEYNELYSFLSRGDVLDGQIDYGMIPSRYLHCHPTIRLQKVRSVMAPYRVVSRTMCLVPDIIWFVVLYYIRMSKTIVFVKLIVGI